MPFEKTGDGSKDGCNHYCAEQKNENFAQLPQKKNARCNRYDNQHSADKTALAGLFNIIHAHLSALNSLRVP